MSITRKFFLTLALVLIPALAAFAGEPDVSARKKHENDTYAGYISAFGGMGKYFQIPTKQVKQEQPAILRRFLDGALYAKNGCMVLGVLDVIEHLDSLDSSEKLLKAQVAWSESFYKEAEKTSRETALAPLLNALERERRGKVEKDKLSSSEIVRSDGYKVIREDITWDPFRIILLRPEIDKVIGDSGFITEGALPSGFDSSWLNGSLGKAELWDQAWEDAWRNPEPKRLDGLISRMVHYHPEGLSSAQKQAMVQKVQAAWGLPYAWAISGAAVRDDVLPKEFWGKVVAAKNRDNFIEKATGSLTLLASNPRDNYEVALLRERLGTEASLKLILDQEPSMLQDPGIEGWTVEGAKIHIASIQNRLVKVVKEREAEEKRMEAQRNREAEEARRVKIAAEREEMIALKRREIDMRKSDAIVSNERQQVLNGINQVRPMAIKEGMAGVKRGVQAAFGVALGMQSLGKSPRNGFIQLLAVYTFGMVLSERTRNQSPEIREFFSNRKYTELVAMMNDTFSPEELERILKYSQLESRK